MTLSGGLVALTIALMTAQGPRVAGAKRAKPPALPGPTEKQVSPPRAPPPPQRARPTPASKRPDSAATPAPPSALPSDGADRAMPVATESAVGTTTTKTPKTKVYSFGAMDVEGKLKTPQLLYFLNRVKLELEMSAPDHRSFMKELAKTAEDPNL